MKTVVYVDVLLGVNLLIAWCLLRAAGRLSASPVRRWRMFAASVLAAGSTLVLLAPPMPLWVQVLAKWGGAVCITAAAFPYCGPRAMFKRALWYFLLNLALAGAVLCWSEWAGPGAAASNNLAVYLNISPVVLVLSVLSVWLALRLAELLLGLPQDSCAVQMKVELGGCTLDLPALPDSGCRVKDPLTGQGVVLISLAGSGALLPGPVRRAAQAFFEGGMPQPGAGMRLISLKTAGGIALLPAFQGKNLLLRKNGRMLRAEKATVGIAKEGFEPGGQPALVGADLLEQMK